MDYLDSKANSSIPLDEDDTVRVNRYRDEKGGRWSDVTMTALADWISEQVGAMNATTGWGFYSDGSGAQALLEEDRTLLTNDKATVIEDQLPSDITTFFDSNAVLGNEGDDRTIRLAFDATGSDQFLTEIIIEFDIGGALGVIDTKTVAMTTGAGVTQSINETFELFCGATFQANGGRIYVTADAPCTINNKTILVKRNHKAR